MFKPIALTLGAVPVGQKLQGSPGQLVQACERCGVKGDEPQSEGGGIAAQVLPKAVPAEARGAEESHSGCP